MTLAGAVAQSRTPKGQRPKITLVIVPPDPGRKSRHLVMVEHKGGGWYTARCTGQAKRCKAGECVHVQGMRWADSPRPIKPVAWESA